MICCIGDIHYFTPTNDLFVFLSYVFIAIIVYSLRYWPEKEGVDRSKLEEFEIIDYDNDILGMEVPVYNEPVKNYKPMGGIGLKVGLFLVVALLASMLVFKSFERVEPFHYSGWGDPAFVETGKKRIYNFKLDEYEKESYRTTFDLPSPPEESFRGNTVVLSFKYIKEPYYDKKN